MKVLIMGIILIIFCAIVTFLLFLGNNLLSFYKNDQTNETASPHYLSQNVMNNITEPFEN